MKKYIYIGLTAIICIIGIVIIWPKHKIGEGDPVEAIIQEAKSDGYSVDGSMNDFYKLYYNNTSTKNYIYEYISSAREEISLREYAEYLAEQEAKNATNTENNEQVVGATDEYPPAVDVFLDEYNRLK